MGNATRVTVSAFGVIVGVAGIEHGIGEIQQGNLAPGGVMILSWPESTFFRILAGEPAMTIVPNFLVSGILTVIFSLIYLVWAVMSVQRKNGGLVLILLSLAMLMVGAGFGPPILGIIVGLAATRINSPMTWWRNHLPPGLQRVLAKIWPWSFGVCLIAWLLLFPGLSLLDYFLEAAIPDLVVYGTALMAFGSLLLTILAGFAHDLVRNPTRTR